MAMAVRSPNTTLLRLENAAFRYEPYPIGLVRPVFDEELYRDLLAAWPPHELFAFMPKLGKKYSLSEVNNPNDYLSFLASSSLWKGIHSQIKSPKFVRSVVRMLREAEVDLGIPDDVAVHEPAKRSSLLPKWLTALQPQRAAGLKTRFEFSMLPADGGHIKPHTDSPGKLITLVVSFCDEEEWRPAFGGGTSVLRPIDASRSFNHLNRQLEFSETEVLHTYEFQPNQCVIFVKTFNSLHAVSPMQGVGSMVMRKTLTINIEIA